MPPTPSAARAAKYRGATILDLDPPPALSLSPSTPISAALLTAFERDYTHLTITTPTKALLGYLSIPKLKSLLEQGKVREGDSIETAMLKFDRRRSKKPYRVITMDTGLDELEGFFEGEWSGGEAQDFAVITDEERKFVLGVATRWDLEEFVKRRPG